ncbi:Sodium- and chloride-dependent glycine transporter 2 [Mizuhopecten yessoensis]|uniref:Sodium-and chloride-dependent glycine transporter 2 n=1 Tax=Mizuhopecten yessoensis TaxID=6573 RepID=A0A210PGR1_MIZYE|nr:Sodium- and chloride-dependent glycine transporter 2 [Mizuhopecten yessoensis]
MKKDAHCKHSEECDADATSDESESKQQVTWSSTLEFVVSLIGYSTGMSDFWRIPYLIWRNGGGK